MANGNSYTYDSENHMISMTAPGTTITMVYDAFGNRVAKTVNGVTTHYLVEDDVNPTGLPQVIEETSAGAVSGYTLMGCSASAKSSSLTINGPPSFYVYDGAGSVRQLTNSAGVVTDEYEYDAYGNSFTKRARRPTTTSIAANSTTRTWPSTTSGPDTINPSTGRFLSRDPEDGRPIDPRRSISTSTPAAIR